MQLDLSPFTSRKKRDASTAGKQLTYYDLFAVVCHSGQINTGHYVNFARTNNSEV
jgi:ubiquitin carboxyl-terminal hydrolase 22/27/51